jgi:hypothetical protein
MTDERAVTIRNEMSLDDTFKVSEAFAKSGFFTDAKDAAKALVKIMAGREIGLGPFASMNGVHIIQGKPSLGGGIIATMVKAHPRYDYRLTEHTDDACEVAFFQDGQELGRSRFSMEDARKAALGNKDNWKKYPRNMLFNRAISNGARWYCPDAFGGVIVYTPEELGAEVDSEGAVIDVTPTPTDNGPKWEQVPEQSKARPRQANGNSDQYSPQRLFEEVNAETAGAYNAVKHMYHALAKELGDDWTGWPPNDDTPAWERIKAVAIKHAKEKASE